MPKEKSQLLAKVETDLAKRLRKKLIDDGVSYRTWLEKQIVSYVGRLREEPPLVRRGEVSG